MARTQAKLGEGPRLTDYISLGVVQAAFPLSEVRAALAASGRESRRQRLLPAHVIVYYVIALGLFMQVSCQEVLRCLLEGLHWCSGGEQRLPVAGESGISQARRRVGAEPLQRLHDAVVKPIAQPRTRGAWYRHWRLVSLDGSTLDLPDSAANADAFGRQVAGRGRSAFPQLRFVTLVENGTHVLFGSQLGPYSTGEATLARAIWPHLKADMLCLADRGFFSYIAWKEALVSGAALVWRAKAGRCLPEERRLKDGSYLTTLYADDGDRRHQRHGLTVRVIQYRLDGVDEAEPVYRLVTSILDPKQAPARELAELYHQRWEVETALDELKSHLRGARIVLRSKTPDLVKQEFYGLMMAHFAVRGLMHEAALRDDLDPDDLSFIHTLSVVRRKLPQFVALPPSAPSEVPPGDPG